jgi:hypothetical protein
MITLDKIQRLLENAASESPLEEREMTWHPKTKELWLGPEDENGSDQPADDVWVYDWRTPLLPEVDPDRDANSDAPSPASEPPRRAHFAQG